MADERWCRESEVALVDRGTRVVVLALRDPASARPMVLEGPAAAVWHALDEPGTSREVAVRVADSVGLTAAEVESDVAAFLEQLAAVGLVGRPVADPLPTPPDPSAV